MEQGIPVIGAHKVVRDTPGSSIMGDFDNFLQDKPIPKWQVLEEKYTELRGKYIYTREGKADMQIELCRDGYVLGGGNLEQWWFPVAKDGQEAILVAGCASRSVSEYITFEATKQSVDTWSGRWNHFEQMPVTLKRLEN